MLSSYLALAQSLILAQAPGRRPVPFKPTCRPVKRDPSQDHQVSWFQGNNSDFVYLVILCTWHTWSTLSESSSEILQKAWIRENNCTPSYLVGEVYTLT